MLGLGLEGSSQRLFPRQGHWYKPTYATKKLWYEIYIHKNSLLPVLSGEIYDSLLTAFFEPHLFRDTIVRGTSTRALTFLALSGGFLGAFLFYPFLGVGIC